MRDPVKIINVYGYAYCGILGPVMEGVAEDMGIGPARTLSLPRWSHMTCETFYGGRWHYLDLDVRAAFRRPDGSLASIEDARRDASLWTGQGPLFFPNDPLDRTRQIYQQTEVYHFYGFHQSGHTMDFVLRQGESFTRWWHPQGGRWHHADSYNKNDWLVRLLEQPPRGPKPNHRDFTIHNYGNGLFVYEPNLTSRSTDFRDGVFDSRDVAPTADGLRATAGSGGCAVFEVRTPYIIVPVVGAMNTREDDREASVVAVDGERITLRISTDHGITWQPVGAPSGRREYDLTRHAAGRYGYLLRVEFPAGQPSAVLRRMRISTWVQVAPASLPSLRRGLNRLEYRTNDHYGLPTRIKEIASNTSSPQELAKIVLEMPEQYDPAQKTARIRGDVVVPVRAMPGTRIAWFSVTGSFRTHQLRAAKNTRNSMAYALGEPKHFVEIYRADMPSDVEHWHTNATREIRLEEPAELVFLRFHGDPAINNFCVYAHCLDNRPSKDVPVRITHIWQESGERMSKSVTVRSGDTYEIEARGEPLDESIEMAVPSDG